MTSANNSNNFNKSSAPSVSSRATRANTMKDTPTKDKPNDAHLKGENMIVNELLCFIANKIDVMPYDIVLKLCTDHYNGKRIENAKNVMQEIIKKTGREKREL